MAEVLDPQTRVDELLFIVGHLIDILERENTAVAHNRFDIVNELLDQKIKLSRAYEIRMVGMERSGDRFGGVESAQLDELRRKSERLQDLAEINERELKIGLATSQRFMEILAESVKSATPTAGTYAANGKAGLAAMSKKGVTASVAIDEKL